MTTTPTPSTDAVEALRLAMNRGRYAFSLGAAQEVAELLCRLGYTITSAEPAPLPDDAVCVSCGHIGKRPPPPALSCCPERKTISIRDHIAQLKERVNSLETFANWSNANWDNQDINHSDFRVASYVKSKAALAQPVAAQKQPEVSDKEACVSAVEDSFCRECGGSGEVSDAERACRKQAITIMSEYAISAVSYRENWNGPRKAGV